MTIVDQITPEDNLLYPDPDEICCFYCEKIIENKRFLKCIDQDKNLLYFCDRCAKAFTFDPKQDSSEAS